MSKTISIFFNTDRTYLTLVDKKPDGLELLYLNSTEGRIDLENPDNDESVLASQELQILFDDIRGDFDRLTITLPSESVLVSKIPGKADFTNDELRKLVNFEIKQSFPQFNFEDFTVSVTPMSPGLDDKIKLLCVITQNDLLNSAATIISPLQHRIDNIEISQLNAHSAFLYNYPELADKNVALACIQSNFIDVSLSKAGEPGYYSLASFSKPDQVGEVIEKEFSKILNEAALTIDAAFFFGSGLSKDVMMSCWETSMMLGMEGKRLNPLRMMRSALGAREREYCSRSFQLFPACIGGSLPAYHNRIKLF